MNRKQRDKNRNTADALRYASTKWSAQQDWKAKLYTERKNANIPHIPKR